MDRKDILITHIVVDELPSKGLQKLYFYSSTVEGLNIGEYFWGTDNNSLNEEYINSLERIGKIIRLPKPIDYDGKKALWVNEKGVVYHANNRNPYPFESTDIIFAPEQLSRAYQIYFKSIGSKEVPKTNHILSLQI